MLGPANGHAAEGTGHTVCGAGAGHCHTVSGRQRAHWALQISNNYFLLSLAEATIAAHTGIKPWSLGPEQERSVLSLGSLLLVSCWLHSWNCKDSATNDCQRKISRWRTVLSSSSSAQRQVCWSCLQATMKVFTNIYVCKIYTIISH
jgi:hypothetical protein